MPPREPSKSYSADLKEKFSRNFFLSISKSIGINRPSEPNFLTIIQIVGSTEKSRHRLVYKDRKAGSMGSASPRYGLSVRQLALTH